MRKRILVIDIGGTHVKLMISRAKKRKFKSGQKLTPREMVKQIKVEIEGWKFDAISIGFPSPVRDGRILAEPKHLGKGWVGFNFEKALGKPVRVVNDAALQALGSYRGGRMLFLGLGTGLGSTRIRPSRTGAGKPIEIASNFQSSISSFICATISRGVIFGPDLNFRRCAREIIIFT